MNPDIRAYQEIARALKEKQKLNYEALFLLPPAHPQHTQKILKASRGGNLLFILIFKPALNNAKSSPLLKAHLGNCNRDYI